MKFLIFGKNGQLATEFEKRLQDKNVLALTQEDCDIGDFDKLKDTFETYKPDIVLNCSAYNFVDKAETDYKEAYKTNAYGVKNLSYLSEKYNSLLIHYSTDYVFDGTKEGLYKEDDIPNPLNEYGKSKLMGEFFVQESLERCLIFRTSWVYGEGKQNFLYKLSEWAKTQDYLKIACDEFSVPTSTNTIVNITLKAIDHGLTGLYHLVNSSYASRYEWAKAYLAFKSIKTFIYPVYQKDFNLPAKRPRFSAMSNEKISKCLDIDIPDWHEEMKNVLR